MEAQTVVDTKPLLRPDQVVAAADEIKSLEAKLTNPLIQDKGEVRKQLVRARKACDEQTPKAPESSEEEGKLVRREKELLGKILEGMPSQEEMRKAPPGAVDKHMRWERANKLRILEWKNIRLRLSAGTSDRDIANLEVHRPKGSSLNMDNAMIPGRQFFMPETSGAAVTFTDAQLAVLRQLSPRLADSVALMSNADREQVKDTIVGIGLATPSKASRDGKRGVEKREATKKRVLSEAHKAAMKAGREAKAKKAAA